MDYVHGFFTAIDRELDQHAKDIRNRVFALYRDIPWTAEQYSQLQPVIQRELERFVQSILEIFDNAGCDKVSDEILGYQITVIPKVEVDDVLTTGETIDFRQDNLDYADMWSEFLTHKHEVANAHITDNGSSI